MMEMMPRNTTNTITVFDDFWDDSYNQNPYSFLSNFYDVTKHYANGVTIDLPWTGEMTASTTEHLFAAAKTPDPDERAAILRANGPGQAKYLGRICQLVPWWEEVKWRVMRSCIEAKFHSGSQLANLLIDTFPKNLREGTTWGDTEWGVDVCAYGEPGHNLLGMILMDHRGRLMDGLAPMPYLYKNGHQELVAKYI
jgi:ribA/ribD-fused uncharacterized protein